MALLLQLTQKIAHGFVAAWARWPRKDKKIDAEKAWNQKVKDPETDAKIHEAFDWQIPILLEREPQYRPLLGSWLRGEEWNNEPPTPKKPTINLATVRVQTPEQTQSQDAVTRIQLLMNHGMNREDAVRKVGIEFGWIKE